MRAHLFFYIMEEVAHACARNTPLECFSSTSGARSHAEAVERDLLVAYAVINIYGSS